MGANAQSYTPSLDGNYGVTITLEDCPIDSDCSTVILSSKSFSDRNLFSIYPNPNSGYFKINVSALCHFALVNQLGQTIYKFSIDAIGESTITLENLSDGIYYLNGETPDGKIANKKIVIQNL